MLAWHVPYLGWTRLPADLSEFEITHFFSLRPEEMSGRTLDAVQRVPSDLLKHLGEQIEVPAPSIATLRASGTARFMQSVLPAARRQIDQRAGAA